jgi:hypothetical protein
MLNFDPYILTHHALYFFEHSDAALWRTNFLFNLDVVEEKSRG